MSVGLPVKRTTTQLPLTFSLSVVVGFLTSSAHSSGKSPNVRVQPYWQKCSTVCTVVVDTVHKLHYLELRIWFGIPRHQKRRVRKKMCEWPEGIQNICLLPNIPFDFKSRKTHNRKLKILLFLLIWKMTNFNLVSPVMRTFNCILLTYRWVARITSQMQENLLALKSSKIGISKNIFNVADVVVMSPGLSNPNLCKYMYFNSSLSFQQGNSLTWFLAFRAVQKEERNQKQ